MIIPRDAVVVQPESAAMLAIAGDLLSKWCVKNLSAPMRPELVQFFAECSQVAGSRSEHAKTRLPISAAVTRAIGTPEVPMSLRSWTMTSSEVADRLNCSTRYVTGLAKKELRAVMHRGRWLYDPADVADFAARKTLNKEKHTWES